MSKLTNILAPLAITASLAGTVNAGDYVQDQRFGLFGAGHRITYTHTENILVNVPHTVTCRDPYGRFYNTTVFSIIFSPNTARGISNILNLSETNFFVCDFSKSISSIPQILVGL